MVKCLAVILERDIYNHNLNETHVHITRSVFSVDHYIDNLIFAVISI